MQPFWRSQFDKALVATLFLAMCGLAYVAQSNKELVTFALQAASGLVGCLLTLVTARRPASPDTLTDPTSTKIETTTSTVQTATQPVKE